MSAPASSTRPAHRPQQARRSRASASTCRRRSRRARPRFRPRARARSDIIQHRHRAITRRQRRRPRARSRRAATPAGVARPRIAMRAAEIRRDDRRIVAHARRARPCAMHLPASRTAMWSEMPMTRLMSCSIRTTAMPASAMRAQQLRRAALVGARSGPRPARPASGSRAAARARARSRAGACRCAAGRRRAGPTLARDSRRNRAARAPSARARSCAERGTASRQRRAELAALHRDEQVLEHAHPRRRAAVVWNVRAMPARAIVRRRACRQLRARRGGRTPFPAGRSRRSC